ncbi:MAG: APC family permease [Clostridia bacterium]|nr:APC family permease [Clostridia bacterium]
MEQKLTKKYGLFTAIAMVVGIVIGSGVFFKAQDILTKTEGNLTPAILAWIAGGLIMVICCLAFSFMATKYEKMGGVVDYAEATVGEGYSYFVGWFIAMVYMPAITGVLAWVSARYFVVFLNSVIPNFAENPLTGPECMVFTLAFMIGSYALNTLSPRVAGKFQVTTTVIKLIPLVLMAVVGVIVGLANGTIVENFSNAPVTSGTSSWNLFFVGLVSTAFAYDGWIIATSVNGELKNAKRNLPIALSVGSLIVMAICVLYNLGIAGGATVGELTTDASKAFTNIFGGSVGAILNLFVALSCLGTLNGLMLASGRTTYALAIRGKGMKPDVFTTVDEKTNMPSNSSIVGLLLAMFWFFYFYASIIAGPMSDKAGWFGAYGFDSSELPIITLHALYIPIYIMFMVKGKEFGVFKRFVVPALATLASLFMMFATVISHGKSVIYYLITFALFMGAGILVNRKNKSKQK